MGIINVETRLSEQRIPADPANVDSREVIQQQAGQVHPAVTFSTVTAFGVTLLADVAHTLLLGLLLTDVD
jgi:hypothetical protein